MRGDQRGEGESPPPSSASAYWDDCLSRPSGATPRQPVWQVFGRVAQGANDLGQGE
jgi:hypothetical protein